MRLELIKAHVKGVAWGCKTELLKDGTLQVSKEELLSQIEDHEFFKSVDADMARPGESTRIVPVKDVIEPRCKAEGEGEVFPGLISDVTSVGSGKTFVLDGAAVVTGGRIVGFQEGIIDMSGDAAEYTPFSRTYNLVLIFKPSGLLGKNVREKV